MKEMVKTGRQGFRCARLGWIAAVSFCLASGATLAAQTADSQAPPVLPWVSDVVKMNDAGIAPDVIANYVKNTAARSTLTADDIIYLRDHGISPTLITAMIEHGAVSQTAQAAPMPAAAPAPVYAQAPPQDYQSPDYAQQPPTTVYYNYNTSPDYGYSAPYTYTYWNSYYPYYPVWYLPYGYCFPGRIGFRGGFGGRSFGHVGFGGGFHGSGFHGFSAGMGGHGGHR
jgi:hypothetical protein